MAGYNFPRKEGLKETLDYLMDRQSAPGSDPEGNMLLICLVSLMTIVDIMQKQISSGENLSKVNKSQSAVGFGSQDLSRERSNVAEMKPERVRENKQTATNEQTAVKEQTHDDSNASDKIVNKVKNKADERTSKIVKWDSMLKKKSKEPLSI